MTRLTSLVLPAFNPGPGVERTWAAVEDFVTTRPDRWEAVFVLDGCTDDTPGRLARLARTAGPRMRVLDFPQNRGKGFAVRAGLLAARGSVRVFSDIDLAYSFTDIARVAAAVWDGAPVAVASREHPESEVRLPVGLLGYVRRRHFQSRVFGAIARTLLPVAQRDTQAGLKGMSAAVARSLVPELRCDGFGFDCELLTACARSGVPVAEVPVCVRYDSVASTTGLRSTVRMLRELWTIRRAWMNRAVPVVSSATVPASEPARPRVTAAA